MRERIWRSLYWRIALGFVGLLAVLLALQVAVFLWISGRAAELFGESPSAFVQTIASDLAAALSADPALDVDAYLNDRYRGSPRPFAVAFVDGRAVVSRRVPPPRTSHFEPEPRHPDGHQQTTVHPDEPPSPHL